jgi:hypothetical protein
MNTRKTVSINLIILLFFTLFTLPALAQIEANVDFYVQSSAEGQPLTVGDPITLRLEVHHDGSARVELPRIEKEWEHFEVVSQSTPATTQNDDGSATTGKDIVVRLFEPGDYQTPPLIITHIKPDGRREELASPVVPIKITSVLTEDLELRDLKEQAELPVPLVWPWVVGGLMLGLAMMAGLGWWLYRRWSGQPVPEFVPAPIIDTRPPEVIAYAELERIEAMKLPAQNRIKEHYSLVVDCLRHYIERRYEIPAPEQTTSELRLAFKQHALPSRETGGFMSLLAESDLVKFARYLPADENIKGLIGKARAVVALTTPEPEPVAPAQVAPAKEEQ